MPLRLTVCPAHAVERLASRGDVDEILAVMPRSECDAGAAFCRWPEVAVPRTVVPVSDLGYGGLVPEDELADILRSHPSLTPPSARHADAIVRVARRALARAAGGDWHLLVHCNAGVSRSVAAALIILATEDGAGHEAESLGRLRALVGDPDPRPNMNLVMLGDRALGRGGDLMAACAPAAVACPTGR